MLIVREFDLSLKSYRDVIGLEGGGEYPYAELAANGSKLGLLDGSFGDGVGGRAAPTTRAPEREGGVLAVQVEDLDAEFHRIPRTGAPIAAPRGDRPTMGLRNFQVFDPDGNLVEVTAPLQRSPEGRRSRPPP